MNANVTTIDAKTTPSRGVASSSPQDPSPHANVVDGWLHDHLGLIAFAVIAGGFVARIAAASGTYLNPDEALQYVQLNQRSALLAYKVGQSLPHPPLYYLLLYFWHLLGRSELMLRLPSIICGTALCWVAFKWIENLFGRAAGVFGLVMVTFCPTLIALSAEVRQYALLLFCMVTALYFLGEALRRNSLAQMWFFSGFLYLAILSHYSAFFFVVAVGVYCLARIADSQFSRKLMFCWLLGQSGALAIYVFLYFTHLAKLRANLTGWGGELDQSYFHSYRDDILSFTGEHTLEIFRYMFARSYVSELMLAVFVAGIAFLFARDLLSRTGKASRLGLLLLLPLIAVWGASIAGVYPYVASRHTVFLAPFVIAASSFLLAAFCRQKLWASFLLATVLMAVANVSAAPAETGFRREDQRRVLMMAAVDHVHQFIPKSGVIFVDYQTSLPLSYYLCGPQQIISLDMSRPDFYRFSCNGYSVVSVRFWKLRSEGLALPFEKMVRSYGLKPGDPVWVFQAGWGGNMVADMTKLEPRFRCVTPAIFGRNISIVPLMVGTNLTPAPQTKCPN